MEKKLCILNFIIFCMSVVILSACSSDDPDIDDTPNKPDNPSENIETIYVPDPELRKFLYAVECAKPVDDAKGLVTPAQINLDIDLDIRTSDSFDVTKITSLEGLEKFRINRISIDGVNMSEFIFDSWPVLQNVSIRSTSPIKTYAIINCPKAYDVCNIEATVESIIFDNIDIEEFRCQDCSFNQVSLANCNKIKEISISDNNCESLTVKSCSLIETISLSDMMRFRDLRIDNTPVKTIDLNNLKCFSSLTDLNSRERLESLKVFNCPLESVDITNSPNLKTVWLNCTKFKSEEAEKEYLEAKNKASLEIDARPYLAPEYLMRLKKLDLTGTSNIDELTVQYNNARLVIKGNLNNASEVWCPYSSITELPNLDTPNINFVNLQGNELTDFNLPKVNAKYVNVKYNNITKQIPNDKGSYEWWIYDVRYEYWTDENGETRYTDKGKGWWYDYEPGTPR